MCVGEKVLISILAFADNTDGYQSIIFEGNSIETNGQTVDAVTVWNGEAITVLMQPDNPGMFFTYVMSRTKMIHIFSSLFN